MVPGSIYMSLLAGESVGPAAKWVTLILFIEVARRANKSLKKAEIFTLFYLAGAIMVAGSGVQGGFHGGLGALWSQFFVQSEAAQAQGLAGAIPGWVAPTDPDVLDQRSLLMWQWLPALALIAFTMIIGRIDNMILGYGLFRLTSDIERLPFPMAPVGAQGILALSEEQEEESKGPVGAAVAEPADRPNDPGSWRWRTFSVGGVLGLAFGAVYLGVPTVTAALLGEPIKILPLPFWDATKITTEHAGLDAVAVAIAFDLGQVIFGMVLPFWAMVGSFIGLLVTVVLNPLLYHIDMPSFALPTPWGDMAYTGGPVLQSWQPGDNMQATFYKNQIDFYFSFTIGISLAIAIAGFYSVTKGLLELRRRRREAGLGDSDETYATPEGRGDIKARWIFLTYLISTMLYIGVSTWLLWITDGAISWPLVAIMFFYGFIYTPIISYVTARLEGIAGQVLAIPFVREASFILSGYHGLTVWFLPFPLHNYGTMTVFYRQCELTGTKFKSIWKSELLLTPIILIGSLTFAHFIWGLGPIPGPQYPYAQEWWEVSAEQQALVFSSTLGGFSEFERAFNGWYISAGLIIGGICFAGLSWLGAPTFLTYGIVRGLNQTLPYAVIPQFIGALIGRYYFQRRMGLMWRQYIPVVAAGYACGVV